MIDTWKCPAFADGPPAEEQVLAFDRNRASRVLVCPAWFDEANKLRRLTVEVMRRLDAAGIDSFLPDLPGCNESLAPLESQTLESWQAATVAAAETLGATHVLTIRAGALLAPTFLPGWFYAAQSGPKLLRGMVRARIIAAREAGITETSDDILETGRQTGLFLGGWSIGAELIRSLETAEPIRSAGQTDIAQSAVSGAGLWLRAEPDEHPGQADQLARIIASDIAEAAE
ncbi:hypothetical protein [Erythrobacter sp. R86502]|uniref:hypothetical protein n=1 Tax=Erythrobacter sp. R86502 TaxID=3093846 RepID=UPI0036D365CB